MLLAIEPLTGQRIAKVYKQGRKKEYADFMQLVASQFPKVEKIRLIQDNLNTHNASSFYENMDKRIYSHKSLSFTTLLRKRLG